MKKEFFALGSVILSGCLGFGDTSNQNNQMASCWANAKNAEEMKQCESLMAKNDTSFPVTTNVSNAAKMRNEPYAQHNEANERNTTASRA